MADNTVSSPALTGRYPRERIAVKLLFLANGLYAGLHRIQFATH